MKYYKFNIDDYRKATVHLSPLGHYIYRQLIDTYYLYEKMIELNTKAILRRLGLGISKKHIEELENVLSDFFTETDEGWYAKRIDSEIKIYQKMSDRNSKIAQNREKKRQEDSATIPQVVNNPTIKNVNDYAKEKGLNVSGFYEFYENNGWKVGKNKMKNWKAAASSWSNRKWEYNNATNKRTGNANAAETMHRTLKKIAINADATSQ